MTCIIGLVKDGKVYIGGDSAGVSSNDYHIRKDKKVFQKDNMVFGFTSSFRMGQILQYNFDIPYHDPRKSDFDYLCSTFIDKLIETFKSKGYATIKDNEVWGGTFIVGYNNNVYMVHNDFQVVEVARPFVACGCGKDYALGALEILVEKDYEPENVIRKALDVVSRHSNAVWPPYHIVTLSS